MKQVLKWWPVIVGVVAALVWLVTGSIELGSMKTEVQFHHDSAASERDQLQNEDIRLGQRIEVTNKKIGRLKNKVDKTSETVVRIETQQRQVLKNQDRILIKLER